MEKIYIFGHINPDTDTICSSIVYGNYLKSKGIDNQVIKLGELNNETTFLLEKFNQKEPLTITTLRANSKIILMDHNEKSQSMENIDELKITQIIDHHKFNIKTDSPLIIRSEPLGSTCTIIGKILFENNAVISKHDASLLIAGIISDTLYFRSPTTTNDDKEITNKLNEIAKIEDIENISLEMFNAKSDLGNMEVEKLIKLDYKEFNFGGKKYGIGVMETTSPQYAINRKEEIIEKLKEIKQKDKLDGVFLSIIDILNEKNLTLFPTNYEKELLIKIYDADIAEENIADLGKIISRKKEIVPKLENYLLNRN